MFGAQVRWTDLVRCLWWALTRKRFDAKLAEGKRIIKETF